MIDRLEFNRDLHILDPAGELSVFFGGGEKLDDAQIGRPFFEFHGRVRSDCREPARVGFYKNCWACFRCKTAVRHVPDPSVRSTKKRSDAAHDYVERAKLDVPVLASE